MLAISPMQRLFTIKPSTPPRRPAARQREKGRELLVSLETAGLTDEAANIQDSIAALDTEIQQSEAGTPKAGAGPIHRAGSIGAPVGKDGDTAIGELIVDPEASKDFQDTEDRLFREQLHDALEKAINELPAHQGDTLRRRFYQARSLEEIAAAEGVYGKTVRQWQMKGLRTLRKRRDLQQFLEERAPYYLRVGVGEFRRPGENTVERIVIRRERLAEPRAERPRLDRDRLEAQAANIGESYIKTIGDPFIRIFFWLRFFRGISWKEAAATASGGKTGAQDAEKSRP